MKGHFTSHYLAEVLRDIFLQEQTGVLNLESSTGPRVTIQFDRGMLVDADSPAGASALAASLRDEGIVSAEVLLDTVPDCSTAADLAAALLSRKAVTPADVAIGVKGVIRRALNDAFTWQGGMYEFAQGKPPSHPFTPDVLFSFESILGGIAGMAHFEPLKEVLVALPGRLRMTENMFLPVHKLALKPHHGFVLSRIDGSMTMEELAQVTPAESVDDALKFAYGLLVFGVVVLSPPKQGAFSLRELMPVHHETRARIQREEALVEETLERMAGRSPQEILGVSASAGKEAMRHAFEQLLAQFRKERFHAEVQSGRKKDLEMINARITEAFFQLEVGALEDHRAARGTASVTTVTQDEAFTRREFFKTEAQATQEQNIKLSEKYHQKAKEYFRESDFYNCIQFCRLAIRFNSGAALSYQLMAEALGKNPDHRWQRQAEEAYQKAIELDPFNVELYVALGTFYRDQGMEIRARKMFEKAVEILPSHPVAVKELKSLRR
jgi:tetratricopeptide (TPR) repeat protein